jgi:hypothetical protein
MIADHLPLRTLLPLAFLLLLSSMMAATCRAQGLVVEGAVEAGEDVEEEKADEVAAARVNRAFFVLNDAQFDQWVFGGPRNSRAGRSRLDALLSLQVDAVARTCGVSDLDRKKLLLAGRGDIKRFFDLVEEKRKKFDRVKTDQNKVGEIYRELLPLQLAVNSGLFGDGSLYSKTLKRILSPEDEMRYQQLVREKNQFRYRARVELGVAHLDQAIGFRDEQRRRLVDLILRDTRPPTRFGQYDYYLVMYQTSQIPVEKIKPLFDDKQWQFLSRQLDQMRGMRQFLRQQGLIPAQEDPRGNAREFVNAIREPGEPDRRLPEDVFTPASAR